MEHTSPVTTPPSPAPPLRAATSSPTRPTPRHLQRPDADNTPDDATTTTNYVPVDDDDDPTDPTDPDRDPTDPTDPTNPGGNNGGTDNIPDTNTPIDEPLEDLWTTAEATAKCVAQLLDGVANPLGLNVTALLQSLGLIDDKTECVNNLVGTPQP